MKEPWKKSCNGKVVITLNDEKAAAAGTTPTEVEVPVDLNWASQPEKKSSSKTVVLVGVLVLLGLTLITLFKVQNLVYSTNYLTWRVQNLESAVGDSGDDLKIIKYKLSLDEDEIDAASAPRVPQPQALVQQQQLIDSNDLKLSESQNQNHKLTSNSLEKSKKEEEEEEEEKEKPMEKESAPAKETEDLNDAREHPNPADPEDLIKPMIETFDIFRNPPSDDRFVEDVIKFLASMPNMPKDNLEIVELNKMSQDSGSNEVSQQQHQEEPAQRLPMPIHKPLILPIDALFRKAGPISLGSGNLKIFQISDKPEQVQQQHQQQQQQQQQQDSLEEEMMPPKEPLSDAKIRSMLPPFEIFKNLMFPGAKLRFFPLPGPPNGALGRQQEQSLEEENPKIMIHSIKLKLRPLVPQEEQQPNMIHRMEAPAAQVNSNYEIIRMHPMQPQQQAEARQAQPQQTQPGMPEHQLFNHFFPIQEILNSVLKRDQEDEEEEQEQARFEPVPFHEPVPKMLPPANQAPDYYTHNAQQQQQQQPLPQQQQQQQQQQQPQQEIEVAKMPVHAMEVGSPYEMVNPAVQTQAGPQPQSQAQQEEPKAMARSTKLNPVESAWNMPTQYPIETVQQN